MNEFSVIWSIIISTKGDISFIHFPCFIQKKFAFIEIEQWTKTLNVIMQERIRFAQTVRLNDKIEKSRYSY